MDTLAKADIFFFVTTIVVVLLGVVVLIILIYVTYIMRELHQVMKIVRRESELISEDIAELRTKVTVQGFKWSFIFAFIRKLWAGRSSYKKASKKIKEE